MAEPAIEIELKFEDGSSFEYRANAIPRVGENIDIYVDDMIGNFEVLKVKHRVSKTKRSYGMPSQIFSYVTVYIK
ncbi:hypothetical protein [Brevibacillus laterosporus]|uniref:hypothetical protein n=1 Tax=Brevibacillus laterosporus TaxID=1465 RepID=UPI000E6CA247|nr:hypothetical protein [Brevibacillus laterosporus]AYB37601.1 hypothetical protein D5F52_04505 [Brevibacillus laterosporus]MBM7111740.1 hypothetical protein [Brevibacillus laterosporus]MED1665695.1 hypothetical protein [Brevibacillus laterosporus]MED1667216.1 hypothetical protein [Brevibacillus laterosporus]MED1719716.1 hypothetical protein [Brevibacillus laterosporus]